MENELTHKGKSRAAKAHSHVVAGMVAAFAAFAAMADVTVDANTTLTENQDWRNQGKVTITSGVTIDLAGHTLKVSDFGGEGTITDSSTGDAGMLEVDVNTGVNVVNDGISLAGNLKLVKSGAGTLTAAVTNQTYVGGTYVNAGKLQVKNLGVDDITYHGRLAILGPEHSVVHVASGAVFNAGGNCNFDWNHFVIDGGTLANCEDGYDMTKPSRGSLCDIELTADSTFIGGYSMVFGQSATTVLNNNVFTFNIADGKVVYWGNTVAENGTVRLSSNGNGWFRVDPGAYAPLRTQYVDWSTVDVEVTAALNIGHPWAVRDYTAQRTSDGNAGNSEMRVKGVFTPETDYFYGCTMQDGSTINLSQKSGVWSTTSAFTGGRKVVGFAANATLTIDLHGRTLAAGDQLIAWDAAPTNLSSLTFQPDAATAAGGITLAVSALGVFVDGADIVVDAWWTGEEDNSVLKPANWICKNGAGNVIHNGLPGVSTVVHFSGSIDFNLVEGESFTWPILMFDEGCKLTTDVDWRALSFGELQGTLDLDGHVCRLSDLSGSATITSTKGFYKYYKFVSTKRVDGPHFELGYLALYAADGTVQSDGITADTSTTDPAALAPGKCCTKDTTTGRSSHYGYSSTTGGASAQTVDNVFNPGQTGKWCVGYQDDSTTPITVYFRLRDDAKPVVGYNLATSIDNTQDPNRRGIAWKLYASSDGRNWRLVDSREYVPDDVPKTNKTFYSPTPYGINCFNGSDYGTLRVTVPTGATLNNTTVALAGGVRLMKDGAGVFVASKTQQQYAGGTEVSEGTLKMGTLGNVSILGIAGSDVTICSNAVVDINGNYNNTFYHYLFKGGTLAHYGSLRSGTENFLGDYEVVADGSELAFANVNTKDAKFVLNGHILRTSVARLQGDTLVVDDGTIDYHCRFYVSYGSSFTASNVTVIANALYQFDGPAAIGKYVEKSTSAFNGGAANMAQILDVFKPDTDFFYGFKLNDGVTIDLTGRSTPMPVTSRSPTNNTLTFADGATITLDVASGPLRRCGKVVSWEVGAVPSNINTLKFKVEAGSPRSPYRVRVKDDGIYLVSNGTMVIVR